MNKLIQKVNWNLPNSPSQQLYMYGEASIEANQEMQEPLEKLYEYENQSGMMVAAFKAALNTHINLLNQAFENEDYDRIVEESEQITKVAYALSIMEDSKNENINGIHER